VNESQGGTEDYELLFREPRINADRTIIREFDLR
jgi:hypothetical protein